MKRSSHLQRFFKIGAFKNFAIFTGKQSCWSLILKTLLACKHAALLKRDYNTGVSLWMLWKFSSFFKQSILGGYFWMNSISREMFNCILCLQILFEHWNPIWMFSCKFSGNLSTFRKFVFKTLFEKNVLSDGVIWKKDLGTDLKFLK